MDENLRDLRYDTTLQRVTTNGNTTNNTLTVYGLNILGNLIVSGNISSNSVTTEFQTLNVTNLYADSSYLNTIRDDETDDVLVTYTSNSVTLSDDVLDNALFRVNKKTITSNTTITSTYNYMSIGPIEIANGVIVTIANGAVWTIV
jgi:hypothetical protein